MSKESIISSESNGQIKEIIKLQKQARERKKTKKFVVEGIKMVQEAINFKKLDKMYVSESALEKTAQSIGKKIEKIPYEIVADNVFRQISDTVTPQGVLAVVNMPEYDIKDILSDDRKSWILLDDLRDPGNLGTIFRTAEAAGVTGILLSKDCVDVYNPKVIRSTMGAVFRMPFLYVEDLPEKIKELQKKSIKTYAAHLRGENAYDEEDYTTGCAFLIGNEGNGLRDEVADCADCLIRIPMEGEAESLNAAVAAAVLMFEAGRQRRKK